jgi:tetratricopeptide (TPR) repeat protein
MAEAPSDGRYNPVRSGPFEEIQAMAVHPLRFVVFLIILSFLSPTLLPAEVASRVFGTVVDEKDQPVSGMTISITDDNVAGVELKAETDEEGKYSVTLPDGTHTYTYHLVKAGFEPFETSFKVPAGATREMNFTVISGGLRAPEVFNEGNAAARAGDFELARKKYLEALELDGSLAAAHAALASVYFLEEGYSEAVASAQAALELDPTNEKMLDLLYRSFQALGDEEKAAEALAALESADPTRAAADHFQRGVTFFEAGEMREAGALFEKALAADPDHAKAHYMLGICLLNTGDTDGAREHLSRFLELAPEDPEAGAAREMLDYLE